MVTLSDTLLVVYGVSVYQCVPQMHAYGADCTFESSEFMHC